MYVNCNGIFRVRIVIVLLILMCLIYKMFSKEWIVKLNEKKIAGNTVPSLKYSDLREVKQLIKM